MRSQPPRKLHWRLIQYRSMRRQLARELAQAAIDSGEPLGWFEQLYAQAERSGLSVVPWADLAPNPNLDSWLDREHVNGRGKSALVVGCGLGDDAEELSQRGFRVTGFDISASAIRMAAKRFPESAVEYVAADLFHPPADWTRRYDLVHEAYTLQVLPHGLRPKAVSQLTGFVSPDGILLMIARARDEADEPGEMPWPLTRTELEAATRSGVERISFEDYLDDEQPRVRRFRAVYKRP